jgi:hypothetical protein
LNRAASKSKLKRLGWDEKERPRRRQGDPQKVKLAGRLRRETTLNLKWIAQRLPMGSRTCVSNLLNEKSRHRCVNSEDWHLPVLDWKAGALYWNCLRSGNGDEKAALAKVRQKYFDKFTRKDLHFFLGTTQEFHFRALIEADLLVRAHLAGTTVEAGFQPASVGRILASSPIASGGKDAALLAGWKPASTVLVVLTRCALMWTST